MRCVSVLLLLLFFLGYYAVFGLSEKEGCSLRIPADCRAKRDGHVAFLVVERLDERRLEELAGSRPLIFIETQAGVDEVSDFGIFDPREGPRQLLGGDFSVDLCRRFALVVRQRLRDHLQHAHAEGVDIDLAVVVLVIELWGHELGGAQCRAHIRAVHRSGEAEIADSYLARVRVDEDIVALQVPVEDR